MVSRQAIWRGLFVAAVVGILVLALMPSSGGADWFPQADKMRHALAFITLWALGQRAGLRPGWALALGLLGFGVGIEIAQSFTPDREASSLDVLADVAGIGLGRWLLGGG
ncbi:MAG: VanZ family protein [Burkholderiaceae bacterium]